jgi:very-short-patch-repair endonuclease
MLVRSPKQSHQRAKSLRKEMSPPEALLWSRLRHLRGEGPTFRRQHPVGPFIADFCCSAARLVIEVDGAHHTEDAQMARDEARALFLQSRGYRVVRVPAGGVMRNVDEVAQGIVETALAAQSAGR